MATEDFGFSPLLPLGDDPTPYRSLGREGVSVSEFEGRTIPDVLTSGDHGRVADWRRAQREALTMRRRPDLWARHRGH